MNSLLAAGEGLYRCGRAGIAETCIRGMLEGVRSSKLHPLSGIENMIGTCPCFVPFVVNDVSLDPVAK